MAVSSNGGNIWNPMSHGFASVTSIVINENNIFAGTDGDGIIFSSDYGTNWSVITPDLNYEQISSLAMSGNIIFAGTHEGVYLNPNNGSTWTQVNNGLWSLYISSLAVSGTDIFAGTYDGGIFFTSNNGSVWTAANTGLTNNYVQSLAIHGSNIYAGTEDGVFKSENNGNLWSLASNGLPDNCKVLSFAVSGNNIFAGTFEHGVFLSTNNGSSWADVNNGLSYLNINALAADGSCLFAGTESGGIWKRPLSAMGAGTDVENFEINSISIYPNPVSNTLFIEGFSQNSRVLIYDFQGKLVLINEHTEYQIDIGSLKHGIYLIKIENESGTVTRKFIKQ